MRKMVRFRNSLIRTVYSKEKGQFVRTYIVSEEEAVPLLSEIDLNGLSRIDYMNLICKNFLVEPQAVYAGLDLEVSRKLTEELFDLIVAENSYLDPANLEQVEFPEEPQPQTRKRKRPLKSEIASSLKIYERVREVLESQIIGQDEAIQKVIAHVGRGLLRSVKETRPICSLLFAGFSGVGKTETARKLAEALQTSEEDLRLLKIDCAEYSESHQVSRLVGAPPGYVGHEEGSYLESHLDPSKIQVLLFDEFEKANTKLWYLLLGALEDGVLTTGQGTQLSLRNCIIILTSNLGTRELSRGELGFANTPDSTTSVPNVIKKELPIELVNRFSDVIIFKRLGTQEKCYIAELELIKLRNNLSHLVECFWSEEIPGSIVSNIVKDVGQLSGEEGVRVIRKRIELIHSHIINKILKGENSIGERFQITRELLESLSK